MSVREILKRSRAKVHPCEISTGTVHVKSMSGEARQQYADLVHKKPTGIPLHLVAALGLCEEDGTMLYDCSTEKGAAIAEIELKEIDGADLQAIVLKLYEVSGLAGRSVKEAEKKSEASPSD